MKRGMSAERRRAGRGGVMCLLLECVAVSQTQPLVVNQTEAGREEERIGDEQERKRKEEEIGTRGWCEGAH
jgi:hypothetical protein